jgi:hypothetical protein
VTSAGRTDLRNDHRYHLFRELVLPEPQDRPSRLPEHFRHLGITLRVARQLGQPVVGVRLRLRRVDRAAVPEAPVDEHSHLLLREDDVGTAADCRRRTEVDSVPESPGMQKPTHGEFWLGVTPLVSEHRASGPDGGGP